MKFKSDIEVQAGLKDSSGALGTSGQVLSSTGSNVSWINQTTIANDVQNRVKAGVAINKGQAVYVTGADGTNIIVGLASNTTEATSSKTLGLLNATVAINGMADVVQIGRLSGLNTLSATVGDPVWLGTGGNLIYGLINKPYAPAHLVFIGVVTRVNVSNGEIFINVQNGFELNEIHDVDIKTTVPVNGDILGYNGTLWVNKTIAQWLGYTPANASGTTNYVSKFTGTTTLGNSLIYDNGTNVGINNTTPNYALDVIGSASISSNIYTNNVFGLSFGTVGYANSNTLINTYTGKDILFSVNSSEKMRLTAAGSLGIGTSSPFSKMEIVGAATSWSNSPSVTFTDNAGTVNSRKWLIGNVATDYGSLNFAVSTTNSNDPTNPKLTITKEGNVGIGVTAPSQLLHVAGNARITGGIYDSSNAIGSSGQVLSSTGSGTSWVTPTTGTITGSGTTNYVTKFTGASSIGNSQLFDNGTNVGIGTTSPSYKFQTASSVNSDWVGSFYNTSTTTPNGLQVRVGVSSAAQALGVYTDGIGYTFNVLGNGNVGIGTTSPSFPLHLYKASSDVVFALQKGSNYGYVVNDGTNIGFASDLGSTGYKFLVNRSAPDNAMIINSSGNVGIGTTSPTQLLHVAGNARITGAVYDSSNSAGSSGQVLSSTGSGTAWITGGGGGGISGSGTTNYIPKFTGSTAVGNSVIYESSGSIGIGTTSPSAKLHVAGAQILDDGAGRITLGLGSGQNEIYSTNTGFAAYNNLRISASDIILTNVGVETMRITSSGTVGIGTTSPSAKLDVQGSLKVDSGPYAFLLVDGTEGVLGAQAGNGGFSYAGGGPGIGGSGDSMAALTSRNTANTDDAVFGLQGIDSGTGQAYFFTAKNVIKGSGPSDPYTPKYWMEVYDMNSGNTYWINLYQ